jgi:hypothetical protein
MRYPLPLTASLRWMWRWRFVDYFFRCLSGCRTPTTRTLGRGTSSRLRSLAAGRTAEAIPLYERTLAYCERFMGADHPDTTAAREGLAALTSEPERHSHI